MYTKINYFVFEELIMRTLMRVDVTIHHFKILSDSRVNYVDTNSTSYVTTYMKCLINVE